MRLRNRLLTGLLAVLVATTALSGCGALAKKADCAPELEFDGQVYRQIGFTFERDQPAGTAQLAWCDDTGRDPRGSVIDSTSARIQVYTLSGFDTAQVVVYAVSGDLYQVFAAKDLTAARIKEIKKSDLLRTS